MLGDMPAKRGQIKYRGRRKQIIDYSGVRYKNITPTDIDGYFEIQNKVYIFIELKLENAPFERGQELAFERLVDNIKKPAIFIIGIHNVTETYEDIKAHECVVWKYRYDKKWYPPSKRMTIKELIDKFLKAHGMKEYVKEL